MQPTTPINQSPVLASRTGDGYYDLDRYMPAHRVREAEADWVKWRDDVKKAMEGIESTLEAAKEAIPVARNVERGSITTTSSNLSLDARAPRPRLEKDPVQTLIATQRDAIDVAKAHLAVAIELQEKTALQAGDDRVRADAAQRQARIANYLAIGAFLLGALGLLYGFLS